MIKDIDFPLKYPQYFPHLIVTQQSMVNISKVPIVMYGWQVCILERKKETLDIQTQMESLSVRVEPRWVSVRSEEQVLPPVQQLLPRPALSPTGVNEWQQFIYMAKGKDSAPGNHWCSHRHLVNEVPMSSLHNLTSPNIDPYLHPLCACTSQTTWCPHGDIPFTLGICTSNPLHRHPNWAVEICYCTWDSDYAIWMGAHWVQHTIPFLKRKMKTEDLLYCFKISVTKMIPKAKTWLFKVYHIFLYHTSSFIRTFSCLMPAKLGFLGHQSNTFL